MGHLGEMMRGDFVALVVGIVIFVAGVITMALWALRRKRTDYPVLAFGIFAVLYGTRMLAGLSVVRLTGYVTNANLDDLVWLITFVIPIPVVVFWRGFTTGKTRVAVDVGLAIHIAFAVIAIVGTVAFHAGPTMMVINNPLIIIVVVILSSAVGVQMFRRRREVLGAPILGVACIVLALAVLYENVVTFGNTASTFNPEPLAFVLFIACLGYVAALDVFSKERRLLNIERELQIAREIQASTLPQSTPQVEGLRMAARYLPMTAVAGDFYDFLVLDQNRVGVLVADVSGHGVPAALIASMVKVALHSLAGKADRPAELIAGLNNILSDQLRGQFVTAAYLLVDIANRRAMYSAAGHPPMLLARAANSHLEPIESNGLLFGVMKDQAYSEADLQLARGDRILLYTDGLVEASDAEGREFGEVKLPGSHEAHRHAPADEAADRILRDLRTFAGPNAQDDTTLIVVDVV
jgi:sigma-B regulation protein RsbU (phosphoserine phosphatase)